jgi:hypothetical protein
VMMCLLRVHGLGQVPLRRYRLRVGGETPFWDLVKPCLDLSKAQVLDRMELTGSMAHAVELTTFLAQPHDL